MVNRLERALALALLSMGYFSTISFAITGNAPLALVRGRHAVMIVGSHGTFCTGSAIARDLLLTVFQRYRPIPDMCLAFDECLMPVAADGLGGERLMVRGQNRFYHRIDRKCYCNA